MHGGGISRLAVRLVRWYQRRLSSRFRGACLYTPSCSAYAIDAIERFGVFRGVRLSGRRILRCRAPSRGGFDPVPGLYGLVSGSRGSTENGAGVHRLRSRGGSRR
jgi:hypothetical protein